MAVPGFDDPALASLPPGGNLYFEADAAVASKIGGTPIVELASPGQAFDTAAPSLMFGAGVATDGQGAPIVNASQSSRGHWSEILNFHGSPAPWVLIGLLIAAGMLHLSAGAHFKGEL